MKASQKQIEFINEVIKQISFFKSSNDISSPTHWCDNEETAQAIIEQFWGWQNPPQAIIEDLTNAFDILLKITQNLK